MEIINVYNRPIPQEKEKGFININLTAILKKSKLNQYVVYIGIGSEEFILNYGLKLYYDEALHYYPLLKKEEYRN